jgi:hypothetical protein
MAKRFLLALLALALSAACSTLDGARVSRIGEIEGELFAIPYEDPRFSVSVIGRAEYGGYGYPILAAEFRPPGATCSVLNSGGLHGNEPGGVEAIYRMIRECRLEESGAIERDFILCMNPWGYRYDRRGNRAGIDLNRDFQALESQETRIIDAYLRGRRYGLVIDHHENSYVDGYSIIAHDEANKTAIAAIIGDAVPYSVAAKMQAIDNYEQGITILGLGKGQAFSQYAALHLCDSNRSFVIETPTAWEMEKRIRCHLDIGKKLEEAFFNELPGATDGGARGLTRGDRD